MEETIAVCFCGAAKTTSVGIPLVTAMWAESDDLTRAYIQIPVLLYTIEQVFVAQLVVYFFKWYLRRVASKDEEAQDEGESNGGQSDRAGNSTRSHDSNNGNSEDVSSPARTAVNSEILDHEEKN
jgi:sodium/bile acid cotransporter 7